LLGSKRQTEVLKELLQDATAENEVLYAACTHRPSLYYILTICFQTFNQELESMYQDVQLPEDKAWASMVNDLKSAKKARNQLSKENL
jgi:protein ECT2